MVSHSLRGLNVNYEEGVRKLRQDLSVAKCLKTRQIKLRYNTLLS